MLLGQNLCWTPAGSGTKEQGNYKITSLFASMNTRLFPLHLHHLHELLSKTLLFSECYFKLRNCQFSLFIKNPNMISLIHVTYQWSVKLEFKKKKKSQNQTRNLREVVKKEEKRMRKALYAFTSWNVLC